MKPKERVVNQILGKDVDRVPLMGGWFHGVANLAALAGLSTQEYLAAPTANLLDANRALHVDCMIHPIVPTEIDQIRTGQVLEATFADVGPQVLVERAEAIPEKKGSPHKCTPTLSFPTKNASSSLLGSQAMGAVRT